MAYINGNNTIFATINGTEFFVDKAYYAEPEPEEQEITGVLPITFNSDGTPLTNYQIYGSNEKSGVIIHNSSPLNIPIQLNGNSINIDLESPLCEREYADYEEQKVYKIGNWLDNSLIIRGYYSTPAIQLQTNTTWGVTVSKGIPLPKDGLYPYTSLQPLYLRSSISGLRASIIYLKGETINRTNYISDTSTGALPRSLTNNDTQITHVAFNFSLPNYATLDPSQLVGNVWIQAGELPSQYHDYMELVAQDVSLPTITPTEGTNTLTYSYSGRQTPQMMVKGKISGV